MDPDQVDTPIELREPREACVAPLFWGALFGSVLLVPAFLAEAPSFERTASFVAGGLLVFSCACMSLQNALRVVRCDSAAITLAQPFFATRFLLNDVKRVVRRDIRKRLRELREIGVPRNRPRQMDTLAEVVVYSLRDRQDRELAALSKDLVPKAELLRLLARLEQRVGAPISDA